MPASVKCVIFATLFAISARGQSYVDYQCVVLGICYQQYPSPAPANKAWELGKQMVKFQMSKDVLDGGANFIRKFNQIVKGRRNASIALNNPELFPFYLQTAINAWHGQSDATAAFGKIKNEIKRVYEIEAKSGNRKDRDNWVFDLFILRALSELFKAILEKAPQNGTMVAIFCSPYAIFAGFYAPPSNCLDPLKTLNNENIESINKWFAQKNHGPLKLDDGVIKKWNEYKTKIDGIFIVELIGGGAAPAMMLATTIALWEKKKVKIEATTTAIGDIENFIKKFNENVKKYLNANKALYFVPDLFDSFQKKAITGWEGQTDANGAFTKIRADIKRAYQMELQAGIQRKHAPNWAYDMFLLRALFELFKAIIEAAKQKVAIMPTLMTFFCSNGISYGYATMYSASPSPAACLDGLRALNDENIAKIDEWFTSAARNGRGMRNDAKAQFGKAHKNWADYKMKIGGIFMVELNIPSSPSSLPPSWHQVGMGGGSHAPSPSSFHHPYFGHPFGGIAMGGAVGQYPQYNHHHQQHYSVYAVNNNGPPPSPFPPTMGSPFMPTPIFGY